LTQATAKGTRFFTLDNAGDTPVTRHRLYELVNELVIDDPSNDGTFMDYERFFEQLFVPFYWRWADCQFLAAREDEWAGLTNVQLRAGERAEFGVTVVKRDFWRQGIARVLKLLALQRLHTLGIKAVSTGNDPTNTSILRLNRSLGF